MSKFSSVGRSNPCQSVLVSFLAIIVSSGLINAVPAPQLDGDIVNTVCDRQNPRVRPLIELVKAALTKAVPMADEFFAKKVHREYKDAMDHIHNFNITFRLIENIPKYPGTPTPAYILNQTNDTYKLQNVYKNLILVNHELWECKAEAEAMNISCHVPKFVSLMQDSQLIKDEVYGLLSVFKTPYPNILQSKTLKMASDENEHGFRVWVAFHDWIIVLEWINDVARYLVKKYCG